MLQKIALISMHTCPLAASEGKEIGGMNIYILELARILSRKGFIVDIFTRSQDLKQPHIVNVARNLRVIHLQAGPEKPLPKNQLLQYITQFEKSFLQFTKKGNLHYDLLHGHYYLSGLIGLALKKFYKNIPLIINFHTLALMKNLVARNELEREEKERIEAEFRLG